MSDYLHHECGIALIRLLKSPSYYQKKYGTALYGVNKLYLLMEKQHNRGQDGAGVVNIKLDPDPGDEYIFRHRSISKNAIAEIFASIHQDIAVAGKDKTTPACAWTGELLLGHLR